MPLTRTRTGRLMLSLTTAAVVAPALFLPASATPADAPTATASTAAKPLVNAQILAFNDFHGHLEPGDLSISAKTGTSHGKGWVPAGGAAYLAAKINAAKRANPASVVVSAGDLVGASPMISAYYHDEPTIETMNKILDVDVVGNHEFDESTAEIRRLIGGGCHPVDGCRKGAEYAGASFGVLAANVIERSTGKPIFPAYTIKKIGGAKIGFIGTVTTTTPGLVSRDGITDVEFLDEAATIKALTPQVRAAGADAVVVLTHSGAAQIKGTKGGINACVGMAGEAIDLTKAIAGQVDAVISAHTHQSYNCTIKGTLLTSAASYGRLLTTLKLTIDPSAHRVTKISARNAVVTHTIKPDTKIAAMVAGYRRLIAPIANRKVGYLRTAATRNPSKSGEHVLGNLVADAQLSATRAKKQGGAQLALVAHGFLRADLAKGKVRYSDIYTAEPFGHRLVTMTLTGRQLDKVLELQFCNPTAPSPNQRVPFAVSAGFRYSYDPGAACGHRVRIQDFRLNGKKLTASGTYRVTTNSFFAAGEGGFDVLSDGTARVTGDLDRDVLSRYLTAHPRLTLPTRNRVKLR